MVLDREKLDSLMDPKRQKEEIERIKSAPIGLILYTTQSDRKMRDVYETLFSNAECVMHIAHRMSNSTDSYAKGPCKYIYSAA